MCSTFRELQELDGEPIHFEWKNIPGSSALQLLHTIQKDLEGKCIIPEIFSDRIICMSIFNDTDLDNKGHEDSCPLTSRTIRDCASRFKNGRWAFLGLGQENKWYHDYATSYEGKWDLCASRMVNDFENSGHPVFKAISPLGRGILKRKNNRDTIHFNGVYSNIDLLYRTVHSANQLCIH